MENKENIPADHVPHLKIHFRDFLKKQMSKQINDKLSHDSLQKTIKDKMKSKDGNTKYKKKQLDSETIEKLDQQLDDIMNKVIDDIEDFNNKIKLDNSFFNRLFGFRENRSKLNEYHQTLKESTEMMNESHKYFEKLKKCND